MRQKILGCEKGGNSTTKESGCDGETKGHYLGDGASLNFVALDKNTMSYSNLFKSVASIKMQGSEKTDEVLRPQYFKLKKASFSKTKKMSL